MPNRPFKLAPRMGSLALAFAAPVAAAGLAGTDQSDRIPPFERTGTVVRTQAATPPRIVMRDESKNGAASAGPPDSSKPPRGLEPRT